MDIFYITNNYIPLSTKSSFLADLTIRFFWAVREVSVKKPLQSTFPLFHKLFGKRVKLLWVPTFPAPRTPKSFLLEVLLRYTVESLSIRFHTSAKKNTHTLRTMGNGQLFIFIFLVLWKSQTSQISHYVSICLMQIFGLFISNSRSCMVMAV